MFEGYGSQNPANLNQAQVGFEGFDPTNENYRHNGGWNVSYFDGHSKWSTCMGFWESITQDPEAAACCPSAGPVGRRFALMSGKF